MKFKQGNILIIIPTIIAFIALLVAGYFYLQNQKILDEKTEIISATPTMTEQRVNWKVYTNSVYDFSFKYPSNWVFDELTIDGYYAFLGLTSPENINAPVNTVTVDFNKSSYEKVIKDQGMVDGTEIKVGGITGLISGYKQSPSGWNGRTIVLPYKNGAIEIRIQKGFEDVGDRILSAFKLMEGKSNTLKVKLYYHDIKLDPNLDNCLANNYIEKEIPKTVTPVKDALNALIASDVFEKDARFKLESLNLKSDETLVLTFPFIGGFTTGGSCRVGILTSQIEKTALQFPEVKRVVFEPEVFQP